MPGSLPNRHAILHSFLESRIGPEFRLLSIPDFSADLQAFLSQYLDGQPQEFVPWLEADADSAIKIGRVVTRTLTAEQTVVLAPVALTATTAMLVASIQRGPSELARRAVSNALEAWRFRTEAEASEAALDESAIQLAQCFEEQNWLRGFARNATSFSNIHSANEIASGILQPLMYLLRAQDVFLLIHPEETERSGLRSVKFGNSAFSIEAMQQLLKELQVSPTTPPVVRNNQSLFTADGLVHALIVVAVVASDQPVGFLVSINRVAETHDSGMPVYDPEFGSGEVGLLEEAAVLISTQAHNIHLLVQSNQLFLGTLHAMSSAIDARDKYTQGHSERVARLSFDLARILGLSEEACQEIYLAGILHDIGKIGVPDAVLLKDGPLTDEEFAIIQQHPEIGYRIVERLGRLHFVLPGVLYHHERWDGNGYPHQLRGEAIPLMARIMAVADAFDAMTSCRPYRNAMPVTKARTIIAGGAAEQWDAEIVQCFLTWLEQRTTIVPLPIASGASLIPQDSPVEFLVQAVMTLGH